MMVSIGCAKKKKSAPPAAPVVVVPDGPYIPPGSGPGQGPGDNWEFGGTAPLKLRSLSVMSDYTGRVMNNPQNVSININLVKAGSGYGGHVSITYSDNGQDYNGYFTSGSSAEEAKYNIWFKKDGHHVWHGFFEDFLGGLIVVIDEVVDLGDGQGS